MRPHRALIIGAIARRATWNAPVRLASTHRRAVVVAHPQRAAVAGDAGVGHEHLDLPELGLDLPNAASTAAASATSHVKHGKLVGRSATRDRHGDPVAGGRERAAQARPMPRVAAGDERRREVLTARSRDPTARRRWPTSCRRRSRRAARGRRACTRPASTASTSASGIDADDVLPVRSSTMAVRSIGMPSLA